MEQNELLGRIDERQKAMSEKLDNILKVADAVTKGEVYITYT